MMGPCATPGTRGAPTTPCRMNLETDYLGLHLRNPIIIGSSPLCDDVDTARRLDGEGPRRL